jgi:hypothetical protein
LKTDTSNRFWIGGAVVAGIGLVFAACDPLSWRLFPRCVLHLVTGWYCPGCGTGRAVAQIAHGHWLTALRLNPVTVLALPLIGVLWATGRLDRLRPVWIWSFLAVLVAFGVLRNLPWQPFTLLAPQP